MKNKFLSLMGTNVFMAIVAFSACAQDSPKPYSAPEFATSGNEEFDTWRKDFVTRAVNEKQKDAAIMEGILTGITHSNDVIRLNESQPEVTRPIWKYIESAVNKIRTDQGQTKFQTLSPKLEELSLRLGVPTKVAIAIWGMETSYGSNKGNVDVVRALSTLAYKGRRTQLGENELLAIHDILKNNYATREKLIGSWAGAMGHTQFMPSSYLAYAFDGDNDGIRDIWNNEIDALASTMNYLKSVGWKADEPWGKQVQISDNFDYSLADGQMRPLSFWRQNGVLSPFADVSNEWQARLLVPTGAKGPKFLVGVNYGAIRHYNASDSYALSVALLSDQIAGANNLPNEWPVNDLPLGRTDAMELQNILIRMGLLIGPADGAAGTITKAALQKFQKSRSLVADGYPNQKALSDLRDAIGIAPPKKPQIEPIEQLKPVEENTSKNNVKIDDSGVPVKMTWPKSEKKN